MGSTPDEALADIAKADIQAEEDRLELLRGRRGTPRDLSKTSSWAKTASLPLFRLRRCREGRMKTTRITVMRGVHWEVPRGFGVQYREAAREQLEELSKGKPGEVIGRIRDLLLLIGYEASISTVAEWDLRKRVEAEVYALNVHLRASDNPIQAHPKLTWLPEPWKGKEGPSEESSL